MFELSQSLYNTYIWLTKCTYKYRLPSYSGSVIYRWGITIREPKFHGVHITISLTRITYNCANIIKKSLNIPITYRVNCNREFEFSDCNAFKTPETIFIQLSRIRASWKYTRVVFLQGYYYRVRGLLIVCSSQCDTSKCEAASHPRTSSGAPLKIPPLRASHLCNREQSSVRPRRLHLSSQSVYY